MTPRMWIGIAFLAGGLSTNPALAEPRVVFINEVTVQGPEHIELYNSLPVPKVIAGWRVVEGGEQHVFPGGTVIPANGYYVADLEGILNDRGGEIALIDLQASMQDGVSYGQLGSAPLPPPSVVLADRSLARAPDAAATTPPPPDPDSDGLVWTLDPVATFGFVNDAAVPALGSSILINEIHLDIPGDTVELYNPKPFTISVSGWSMTNGIGIVSIGGAIPGFGFMVVTLPGGVDIDATNLIYLFDGGFVRKDQIGLEGHPSLRVDNTICFGRTPDGAGPNLGYDWPSSGGDVTLFPLVCTLGSQNRPVTGIPLPERALATWGWIKSRWAGRL